MNEYHYDKPFPLKQYYLFYAAIGGIIFYIMLFAFFIHAERQALYDQYVQHLIDKTNSLYNDIHRDFLSIHMITLNDIKSTDDEHHQELRNEIDHIIESDFTLKKVKVFNSEGIVLYDHINPKNEGKPYQSIHEVGFSTAQQGNVSSRLEQNSDGSRWMEVYLPIQNLDKMVGILELYEDVTRFENQVYVALKKALIVPTVIFIAFNLVLFVIIVKANRIINSNTNLLISIRYNMEKYLSRSATDAIYNAVTLKQELFRGEKKDLIIFFSDIRGFTNYSESHAPELVVRDLNNLIEIQAKIIHEQGGVIDKFVGDEIMAIFPVQSAAAATLAALNIVEAVESDPTISFKVGISVHEGEAVVGSIGTQERRDYTAIGNTINTGARLCSVCKPGEVIISSAIYSRLSPPISKQFSLNQELSLKGKTEFITTYSSFSQTKRNTSAQLVLDETIT